MFEFPQSQGPTRLEFGSHETYNRIEGDVMMFQDSYIDPMGSYMVYAPISAKNVSMIMNGGDSMVPIFPSGFLISEDHSRAVAESSNSRPGGSVLTMSYQLLICSNNNASIQDQNRETVVRIVASTLQNIITSLNISKD
ncbi:hypothetical protein JHK87_042388 [Glycine soja]|nr:hypothetical protein JHK87_042388 [Glycine soja]